MDINTNSDQEILYTIGELSQKYGTTIQTIRWYEKELSLDIKRNELGQRIYGKDEIELFDRIFFLKNQGLNLKAIKVILSRDNIYKEEGTDPAANEPVTTQPAATQNSVANYNKFIDYFIDYMDNFKSDLLNDIKKQTDESNKNVLYYISSINNDITSTTESISKVDDFIDEWRKKHYEKKGFFRRLFGK